jgi:hypothetical protein
MLIIWCQRNDQNLNALPRPVKKLHQVVWDSLLGYGRLEWQRTLMVLEKTLDVAYEDVLKVCQKKKKKNKKKEDVLKEFDNVWRVKGLIVTRIHLVVTWKVRPHVSIIS